MLIMNGGIRDERRTPPTPLTPNPDFSGQTLLHPLSSTPSIFTHT